MTGRLLVILETVQPAALVVRRDLIAPLVDALGTRGGGKSLRLAVVSEVEGAASRRDASRLADALGVPVRRLLRADAAFVLAGDCGECGLFHIDASYRGEASPSDEVLVSTKFAAACPAIRYRLGSARIAPAGCRTEPKAWRLEWE
jgi:hypothetical protein